MSGISEIDVFATGGANNVCDDNVVGPTDYGQRFRDGCASLARETNLGGTRTVAKLPIAWRRR